MREMLGGWGEVSGGGPIVYCGRMELSCDL